MTNSRGEERARFQSLLLLSYGKSSHGTVESHEEYAADSKNDNRIESSLSSFHSTHCAYDTKALLCIEKRSLYMRVLCTRFT